jgi:signal transduction histidine kinase
MFTTDQLHLALRRAVIDSQTHAPEVPVGLLLKSSTHEQVFQSQALEVYNSIVKDAWATLSAETDYIEIPVSSDRSVFIVPIRIPKRKPKAPEALAFCLARSLSSDLDFIPFALRTFASLTTAILAVSYSNSSPHSLVARAFQAGAPDLGLELMCDIYGCDAAILWMYRFEDKLFESYEVVGAPEANYTLGLGMGIVGQLRPTKRMVVYTHPSNERRPFHPDLFKLEGWLKCQAFAVCSQGAILGAVSLYWNEENENGFLTQDDTSALGDLVYGFLAEEVAELTIIVNEERYEQQLERLASAQALTTFLHDVQKALRDASTSMNAAAVLLAGRQAGDRQLSQNLVTSARFIDACMNRMSRLALLQERQHTTHKVDLQALLSANKPLYEIYTGVLVLVQPGSKAVWVRGDRLAIERALLNLVTNAVYWTEAKQRGDRRVDVGLRTDDGSAVIEVADTGVGINSEIAGRILEKFVTGRPDAGTGMGLSTVAETMKKHGGKVTYFDNASHGATFRLTFPLVEV